MSHQRGHLADQKRRTLIQTEFPEFARFTQLLSTIINNLDARSAPVDTRRLFDKYQRGMGAPRRLSRQSDAEYIDDCSSARRRRQKLSLGLYSYM